MEIKLFDSELKVMEVLWKEGELTAGQIAKILKEQIGWNRNTTYTVIKKLVEKETVLRCEPGFLCKAQITKEQIRQYETKELLDKLFDSSAELFLSAFLKEQHLSEEEVTRLKQLIENLK